MNTGLCVFLIAWVVLTGLLGLGIGVGKLLKARAGGPLLHRERDGSDPPFV